MLRAMSFVVNPGWGLLMTDLGVNPGNVLRRAGLPDDLLGGGGPGRLALDAYFSLWTALDDEANDPELPIRIARAFSMEVFDPPIFAAACSPNLNIAAQRIAAYKHLIGPLRVIVTQSPRETVLRYVWPAQVRPPALLAMTELLFWVALVRLATRRQVQPLWATSFDIPASGEAYRVYLGVPVTEAATQAIAFSADDATRPFLTANEPMWGYFEPQLRSRLSELVAAATVADRVRAALLESLPAGNGSIERVAARLAVSPHTLQRKLAEDATTFQQVRIETRETLARRYLANPSLTVAEISFLLGYDNPTSFYRAFHNWTGLTPERARSVATHR